MNEVDELLLEHFGTKGMRWGVRKERNESSPKTSHKKRNAAIILGSAAAVGAITVGAFYAKKHMGISVKDIPKATEATKKFAESIVKEPVGIVHASRGRGVGFTFPQRGGLANPMKEYISSGLDKSDSATRFIRYGANREKIAASFLDPLGRKDRSGRVIPHMVMLPKDLADGITDHNDLVKKIWPMIKDISGALYESNPDAYGPGF